LAGSSRATDRLVAALNDDAVEVRIRAAKALGSVGGTTAIRSLAEALEEPTRWSTLRIADILSEMGPDVVDDLVEQFPRMSTPAQLAALDILARVRSLHVAPWLRKRLTDAHADVRARACHAIGALGDPDAGPDLRATLLDAEWPARAMAAKALGRIRHMDAIPDLCDALRDPEWWVRANAARALRALGAPGLDALVWMLNDRDAFARQQAVLMLEEAGMLDEKVDRLGSANAAERDTARAFVRRFIEAGQVWRLHELASAHSDPQVRHILRAEFEEQQARAE
jgi:HEAT repeat protein